MNLSGSDHTICEGFVRFACACARSVNSSAGGIGSNGVYRNRARNLLPPPSILCGQWMTSLRRVGEGLSRAFLFVDGEEAVCL